MRDRLRKMLNEVVPTGGTEADTNFTDAELDNLLNDAAENIYLATSFGWTLKAGLLKDRVEKYKVGQESYDKTTLKDMADHALKMARQYADMSRPGGGKPGGARMLKVKPPEVL